MENKTEVKTEETKTVVQLSIEVFAIIMNTLGQIPYGQIRDVINKIEEDKQIIKK